MRLILAEKRSMADAIAAGIGVRATGKTHYEGKDKSGAPVMIAWAQGHLIELIEPDDYSPAWKTWGWDTLPLFPDTWKTRVIRESADRFKVIKELLPKATEVMVATDAGREGELIADLILSQAGSKKPCTRLWTSALTPKAIAEAYAAAKPWGAYQGLREAAHGRSRADWLVGMSGTRGLTLLARAKGRKERGSWPVGRVMTPTLAILVQREKEILAFKSEDFWTLEIQFAHAAGTYKGKWFKGDLDRFKSEADAKAMAARTVGRPARIASCETKPVSKPPEQFYSLAAIQQEASKRFKFSVDKTLEIVASLYEAKVMSYPRTSSRHLNEAEAVSIPTWLKTLARLPQYEGLVAEIKPGSLSLGKRFVDDAEVEDHTALMPTDQAPNWASLSDDQQKIYDLVARRFLGAFFPNRLEEKTVLITEVATAEGQETFKSTGTVVMDAGWSRVDQPAQSAVKKRQKGGPEGEDDEDAPLAIAGAGVCGGDEVAVGPFITPARKTQPPKRLTDGDLIRLMLTAGKDLDDEEMRATMRHHKGIGTEATRAAIIGKLLAKGTPKYPREPLVGREKGFLVPTDRGMTLIALIPFKDLTSAELTARWEQTLDDLAAGKGTLEAFMGGIRDYTQSMVDTLRGTAGSHATPSVSASVPSTSGVPAAGYYSKKLDAPCPKCGAGVFVKSASGGGFYAKCSAPASSKCYFGFACDLEGNSTIACVKCDAGRVKITPSGQPVCGDCEAWQTPRTGAPSESGTSGGHCPKCKKGMLNSRQGQYGPFTHCSDRACGLIYDSDLAGKPNGGFCKACKGPVKKTKSGSRICVLCDAWQDGQGLSTGLGTPGQAVKPATKSCLDCGATMKVVWVAKKTAFAHRCDACNIWLDAPVAKKPAPARARASR